MTETAPRQRNAAATRAAILEAARRRFSRDSYDNVGLREIASDVGVDAALVSRYFGSKEDLFSEVLLFAGDGSECHQGCVAEFGAHMIQIIRESEPNPHKLDWLLIMLRSSSSPVAGALVRERCESFYKGLADWLGGDEADLRSRLAGTVLLGMMTSLLLNPDFGLKGDDRLRFDDKLAALFQASVS